MMLGGRWLSSKTTGSKKILGVCTTHFEQKSFRAVVLAEEIRVEIGGSCRARRWNQSHLKYGQFGLTLTLLSGAPDLEFLKKTRDDGQFYCVLDWRVFFFCLIFAPYARWILGLKCSRLKTLVLKCFLKSNFQLEVLSVKEQRDFEELRREVSKVFAFPRGERQERWQIPHMLFQNI